MKKNYKIKILDAKKDSDLLFKIVEHENKVLEKQPLGTGILSHLPNMEKFLQC